MRVRVILTRAENSKTIDLRTVFIMMSLNIVDDAIHRNPDYIVRGKYQQTITFLRLSIKEAQTIVSVLGKERRGNLVKDVVFIRSRKGEEDDPRYVFEIPAYKDGEQEKIEGRPGFKHPREVQIMAPEDIEKAVREVYKANYMTYDELRTPVTTLTYETWKKVKEMLRNKEKKPRFYYKNP